MWQPVIDKMKSLSESERLKQAEDNIKKLNETVAQLEKRIEELETKNDKETI